VTDPAREVAFRALQAVSEDTAFANLVLPQLISAAGLDGRDAALATELTYGTLRAQGTLREILSTCVSRTWSEIDAPVRDLLLLGAYQLLRTRIPPHAAVSTTVDLARAVGSGRASGLLNAVLRKVSARDWDGWVEHLARGRSALTTLALRTAHPEWIADAFAQALAEDGRVDLAEAEAALAADDLRPVTHLVVWPGLTTRDELVAESGGTPGPFSPYAVRLESGGDPGDLASVRERRAAVQDEGSQLCALALANAPLNGPDERWLDLCAGPGGKAALLAALAAERGAVLTANELHPHRATLVRMATYHWNVEVVVGDAREFDPTVVEPAEGRVETTPVPALFDRILLDAPCTGLGALRRRPDARWRRTKDDLADLVVLQRELLAAALQLLRPGGVLAYVTCSPHPAETTEIVAGHNLIDARSAFPGVDQLGDGPTVQLWPHRHGTDAMFCALIRG
jgi:16S rRNA (cytosine967-C5)-methyltransferase